MTRNLSRAELIGDESEAHFQARLRRRAAALGWKDFHQLFSMGTRSGLPDLMLLRAPRLVFAELKSEHGRVLPSQTRIIDELRKVETVDTYLWRPSQEQEIWRVLA